ncbi:MAG: pyridoxal-dependent decarboxylase [Planctomycetota bacterium]|nr:pyridoxal-dependent decarboxylase [Planctomycetota bacterium]MDA0933562.1 pyridoxal-dependent decarboxylase [Planctomycetota bacterium]
MTDNAPSTPPDEFRDLGHRLVDLLADHLAAARGESRSLPVLPGTPPAQQLAAWGDTFEGGADPIGLWRAAIERAHHLHHPRSVGHQVSAPHHVAALTDLLANTLNNSAAIYEMGPVATAVERRVVRWMCDRLGFPATADGLLTSGGSLGNLTALLAMRQVKAGYDLWHEGQSSESRFAVLVGAQTHYCVERAVRVLGWGDDGFIPVPTDPHTLRMDPAALPAAFAEAERRGRRVIGVVASACSTSTGAIDPLTAIADFCEARDLWFHVDGAHGASLVISARERAKLAGIERADSVVWDAHKTLLCSSLVTGVLFRQGAHVNASFAPAAEYLFVADDADVADLDLGRRTLECTKPAFGLKLYATLASVGEAGIARYLERMVDVVAEFADAVDAAPDFELAHRPDANIVCFRHVPEGSADLDQHQARVRRDVVASGRFYITRTSLRGETWLRCTVLHPETGPGDLIALLDAIRSVSGVAAC